MQRMGLLLGKDMADRGVGRDELLRAQMVPDLPNTPPMFRSTPSTKRTNFPSGAAGPSVVDHPTPASNAKPTAQHPGPSLTHAKPSPAPITVQPGPVSEAADRPPDAGPVELGSNKRAEVTTFKGRSLLSLREYYEVRWKEIEPGVPALGPGNCEKWLHARDWLCAL